MRFVLAALLTAVAFSGAASAEAQPTRGETKDLVRARVLDQQGVREFREGRYNDAIRYFEEAYKLGAPSSELWNMARCYLKLDDPEHAAETIELYLDQKDLSPQDRSEAKGQLDELNRRHSVLTIASSPTGARVAVDGRRAPGRTPLSLDLTPGTHTVAVEREGYPPYVEDVEAKYGRSVIIDARLGKPDGDDQAPTEPGASAAARVASPRRFSATAELGVLWARLGSFPGPAHPAAFVGASYAVVDTGRIAFTLGLRGTLTEDTWGNGVAAAPPKGCTVSTDEQAFAPSAFAAGALAYRPTSRLRVGGDLGIGAAFYTAGDVGGDLFNPACGASTGMRPAFHGGAQVSYSLLPALRVLVSPIVLELSPAFGDARQAPLDATGPWLRIGAALGLAVDL